MANPYGDPPPPNNPVMMYKGRLLVEQMRTIAESEPAVLQALVNLANTREKFEAEHKRRCERRIVFSRR